jgi:signal transduction histidine kinase
MFRYFLFLIHSQFKPPLTAAVIVFPALMITTYLVTFGQAGFVGSLSIAFFMTLLLFWRYLWSLLRFGKAVRGFRPLSGKGVVLRYASELEGKSDLAFLLQKCEETLKEFNERFGFALKRQLVVFLFDTPARLSRLWKMRADGFALNGGDAIILACGGCENRVLAESIRHELAHLFSHYWGQLNPPLKGEGLATWLQGTLDGKPLDMQALALFLTDRFGHLSWIVDPALFYSTHWYGYTLAGSFTGFLIRRFGWDSYGGFFQESNARNFRGIFQKAFGLSLLTAERQWREELFSQRESFEPELSDLVRKRHIQGASNAWQFYRCVELADELSRMGQADMRVVGIAAHAHAMLGHFDRAAEMMKQVVKNEDPSFRRDPSAAWIFLGELYDLLGQREEAICAYRQCLAAPDCFFTAKICTHRLARRHLRYPFTEEEWLVRIKPRLQKKLGW